MSGAKSTVSSPAAAAVRPDEAPGGEARRLVRNSQWNVLGWLGLLLLSFVSAPIMVRQLGADLYGLLALLTSFIAPLGLMDFGIGEATVKYLAESIGRKNAADTELYLRSTLFFNVIIGVLGALAMFVLASVLVENVFNLSPRNVPLAKECLFWLGLIWCATQVRQTFVGSVTALQDYRAVSIGTFLTQATHTGTGLIALLAGGGLLGMIRCQAGVAVLSVAGWWWLAARRFPGFVLLPSYNAAALKKTARFGLWQMLNNLCGILTHQSQRWLLGALLSVAGVGFYNVGSQLVTMVYSAVNRVGQVMFPSVSQMQGAGREDEAGRLMLQASWGLTSLAISGFVVLAVFASDVLRLWISGEFAEHAAGGLRILCIGYASACLFAIPNYFLLGTGRPQWLSYAALAQGAVTLLTAVPLITRWGVAGAAAAITLGTLVQPLTVALMWRRLFRARIGWPEFAAASFGPWFTGLLLGFLAAGVRSRLDWRPGWFALLASCALCFALVWLLIQATSRFSPGGVRRWQSQRDLIGSMLGRLRQKLRAA